MTQWDLSDFMHYCKEEIKDDCEELLSRFQQTESVRYEIFSKIWREMKFSNIFYGRLEGKEKRGFSCQLLSIAFTYLLPPYTFQIRVGGLYLLYGLYFSQLLQPREKIRFALRDWEEVRKFVQDAVNAQHFDVVYIFRKLLAEKAFHFTATRMPLCFHVKKLPRQQRQCEDFMDKATSTRRPQELVSMDMLEELSNVHEHYEQMKTAISATPEPADPVSSSVIRTDLVPQLRNTVLEYYKWQERQKDSRERGDEDGGEGTSQQQECSKRAVLIASIKSKTYGQVVEASKSRRHRQVELDVTSNETQPPISWRRKRGASFRERTRKSLKIDDNMKDSDMGMPWCLSETEARRISGQKARPHFKW